MPAKSQSQRRLIFGKRGKYGSEKNTPKKWKWIWEEGWENEGKLPKKKKKNESVLLPKFSEFENKKYLTKFGDEIIDPIIDEYYVPEITLDELEKRKQLLFNKFKETKELSHLSDEDLRTSVDVLYKIEIKNGLLRIIDES